MSIWQTYFTPTSVEEVLRLLAEYGPEATHAIAGGTDLLLELERGLRRASVLIDISRTPGLDGIVLEGDCVRLGPLVTHNRLAASSIVGERLFPLAQAAWSVGAPAIRNRGTLGGNLITASPSGDTIPPLMALGATLVLRSVRGERRVPIQEFFKGVRQVDMAPDEMLVEVRVPAMRPGERGVFLKLGLRRALAVSVVNVAVVVRLEDQLVTRARIALGSVAPTVLRACEAEGALVGSPLSSERIEEAADLAARAAIPIDDIHAGAEYRREMVRTLVRRADHPGGKTGAGRFPRAPALPLGPDGWEVPLRGRKDCAPYCGWR